MSVCLIFDLDGTLVDSEGLCNQAYLDLLPEIDESLTSLTERNRGRKLADILSDLETRLGKRFPADFASRYRKRVAELFDSQLKPMPGAAEFLAVSHLPRCVASSGPPAKISHALQVANLEGYFQHIFSAYDIGHWKPDPQLFLHAASELGFPPEKCVVIEDSNVGIAAAEAAGMTSLHFLPLGGLKHGAAYASFKSMSELSELLGRVVDEPRQL